MTVQDDEKQVDFGYKTVLESEKEKYVKNHFNTVARKYDFMNTLLSFGIHYLWKRIAVNMLAPSPGNRIIDVCGGTADLSILAARRLGKDGRIVLFDINKAMMMAGRPKLKKRGLQNMVHLNQGDAESIGFPDRCFDAAMVGFGIRNLTHMEEGFREMHRVLKPGGRFLCLEFSEPTNPVFKRLYDFYSFYIMPVFGQWLVGSRQAYTYLPESIRKFPKPDALKKMLEGIGFKDVAYKKLTNGIAVIHVGTKG